MVLTVKCCQSLIWLSFAPQVASNFEDMKAEQINSILNLLRQKALNYIKLTRDGKGALAFVQAQFD